MGGANWKDNGDGTFTQLEGIATAWKGYWTKVTGGVSTMSTSTGR